MKPVSVLRYLLANLLIISLVIGFAQPSNEELPKLDNPINPEYLKENLKKETPRLILTSEIIKELKQKIKSVPEVGNYYAAIRLNADMILEQPLLKREKIGRRLLSVSREMLYRMGILSMVYNIEENQEILDRINEELLAVCAFVDWNPSHYLDVAEMSLALAIAIDWVGNSLPSQTVALCKNALIDKGIIPSYDKEGNSGWVNGSNNWNQVCHGGMIAAAIAIAEQDPELAAKTISRALDGMPHALIEYGPDGVYPEGSTYWGYGTSFSVLTSSMLRSAFGQDFGLAEYPAFLESAIFRKLCNAPSGWYYNFADCGDKRSDNPDIILAWFAWITGNAQYFEKDRFNMPPDSMGKLSRIAAPGLVWLSQFEETSVSTLPLAWKGNGSNPIVIFREDEPNVHHYYFGGKGGRGTVNHGNMDAGSFIFELDGVRWSVDPGNQSYHELEKTGFDLWARCQACDRWKLLTKNNFGHSTLTVNNELHVVDGFAAIIDFTDGPQPSARIDLSPTFSGQLKSAQRTFIKDSPTSLIIQDRIEILPETTQLVTWQMMTTADIQIDEDGATLIQDGKKLKIINVSHPEISISTISLDPPPFHLDRRIEGLKRVEIRIPAYLFSEGINTIEIQLKGFYK